MGTCKSNLILLAPLLAVGLTISCSTQQEFGILPAQEETRTNLSYNNEVDVLFLVDTSDTMKDHQEDLSEQTSLFLDALNETRLDFRIGVTTMDMRLPQNGGQAGYFVGTPKVLTAHTPSLYRLLEQRIGLLGENGSGIERGLEAMKTALERESSLYPNSAFFRPNALLVLVFLSNEDDLASDSSIDYIGFLDDLKPPLPSGERSWVSHFIGVLPDVRSCDLFPGTYTTGYKYIELSEASGGSIENICLADLRVAVNSIRSRVIQYVTDIRLARIPDISTIRVHVNGVEVPMSDTNGWSYVSQFNLIRFHGSAIPSADALVNVDYDPVGIKQSF